MNAAALPEDVSQLVAKTFRQFGARLHGSSDLEETILIRDGQYVARTYRAEGLMAMWFVKQGIVQFYGTSGDLLQMVRLLERTELQRAAA